MMAATILVSCTNNILLASSEPEVIHVGGKVLCQDCSQGWSEWIQGAKPIKGCKVSLTCMDKRSRVVHYASDTTDELGKFEIVVNKYIFGKQLDVKLCSVRLVLSPEVGCNILTDFGGGKSGVKLNRPSLVYRNLIKYVLNQSITPLPCVTNLTPLIPMMPQKETITSLRNSGHCIV